MTTCWRTECQTTAGCAHRGPNLEMCCDPPGIFDLERMRRGSSYEAMLRAAIIEECARLVECEIEFTDRFELVAAIRALKHERQSQD